jgi:hypothetical protein
MAAGPRLARLALALLAASLLAATPATADTLTTSGCTCDSNRLCGFLTDGEDPPGDSFGGACTAASFCAAFPCCRPVRRLENRSLTIAAWPRVLSQVTVQMALSVS